MKIQTVKQQTDNKAVFNFNMHLKTIGGTNG